MSNELDECLSVSLSSGGEKRMAIRTRPSTTRFMPLRSLSMRRISSCRRLAAAATPSAAATSSSARLSTTIRPPRTVRTAASCRATTLPTTSWPFEGDMKAFFPDKFGSVLFFLKLVQLHFNILGVALAYLWVVNIGVILNEADRILHSYLSGWFQLLKLNKSRHPHFVTCESDHLTEPLSIDTFDRKFIYPESTVKAGASFLVM